METYKKYLNEATVKEWGVKWREFDKNDRLKTKEKFFTSKKRWENFLEKLDNSGDVYEIIGTLSPDSEW